MAEQKAARVGILLPDDGDEVLRVLEIFGEGAYMAPSPPGPAVPPEIEAVDGEALRTEGADDVVVAAAVLAKAVHHDHGGPRPERPPAPVEYLRGPARGRETPFRRFEMAHALSFC